MKIVTKDPIKLKQEKLEKERRLIEDDKREKYLDSLRENRAFQKYVVQEIIDKEIAEAEKPTFSNVKALIAATPEEVKNIALSKSANVLLLKKIKSKIT